MRDFITRVFNRGRKLGLSDFYIVKLLVKTGAVSQTTKWERPTPDFTEDEIKAAQRLAANSFLAILSWRYLLYGDTTELDEFNAQVRAKLRAPIYGGELP